jgi:hypothetical protein
MLSFPRLPNNLTVSWLNSILPEMRITDVRIEPLEQQGLSSCVARVTLAAVNDQTCSFIAKYSSPDAETKAFFGAYYAREVNFYSDIAERTRLRVPHCVFASYDETDHAHLILLEDLGHMSSSSTVYGIDHNTALRYVRSIAVHHAQWWESESLADLEVAFPRFGYSMGTAYNANLVQGLELLGIAHHSELGALATRLGPRVQGLWNRQWQTPRTLIQWDAHASNLLDDGIGTVVIDWQNCMVGQGICDVTRFCVLSLETPIRQRYEKAIVNEYANCLRSEGIAVSTEALWHDYIEFMPLIFAQQLRFLTTISRWDSTQLAWKKAVGPRVVAALQDAIALDSQFSSEYP